MTLGEFRKATEFLTDETPIVFAHTWRSPFTLGLGSYLGANGDQCLILDAPETFKNKIIYAETHL